MVRAHKSKSLRSCRLPALQAQICYVHKNQAPRGAPGYPVSRLGEYQIGQLVRAMPSPCRWTGVLKPRTTHSTKKQQRESRKLQSQNLMGSQMSHAQEAEP